MTNVDRPRGEIFDLGYRNYDGPRLGRAAAVRALVGLSLRNTFGLGRGTLPKVLAFGLTTFAFLPALGTVIGGALGGEEFEVVAHHEYFGLIQVVIVLFVAAMASDLIGNDRRNNTLALYFSRPIRRDDYVLAKIGALALALLALTLLPQLLVFAGNWLGATDGAGWFGDHVSDLWRIAATSVLASVHLAAVGVTIAMFTTRRAFALLSVLAALLVAAVASSALVSLLSPGWAAAAMLASPLTAMDAASVVIFDAVPALTALSSSSGEVPDQVAYVGLPSWVWIAAVLGQTAIAVGLATRHYRKVS